MIGLRQNSCTKSKILQAGNLYQFSFIKYMCVHFIAIGGSALHNLAIALLSGKSWTISAYFRHLRIKQVSSDYFLIQFNRGYPDIF